MNNIYFVGYEFDNSELAVFIADFESQSTCFMPWVPAKMFRKTTYDINIIFFLAFWCIFWRLMWNRGLKVDTKNGDTCEKSELDVYIKRSQNLTHLKRKYIFKCLVLYSDLSKNAVPGWKIQNLRLRVQKRMKNYQWALTTLEQFSRYARNACHKVDAIFGILLFTLTHSNR